MTIKFATNEKLCYNAFMIKIENLSFRYDKRFYALHNVNLNILDNKKYMIFSSQELESQTLFRIITKQEKTFSGDVFIDNENIRKINIKNLDICYITKDLNLIKNKDVLYNIAYPLIIRKENKKNSKIIAEKLLEKYNLINLKHKKIKKLTNGEKLSLIMLRSAIREPKLIIFDYFNFDEFNFNLFFKITKNATVLFSTTDKNLLTKFNNFIAKNHSTIGTENNQFELIEFVGGTIEK